MCQLIALGVGENEPFIISSTNEDRKMGSALGELILGQETRSDK